MRNCKLLRENKYKFHVETTTNGARNTTTINNKIKEFITVCRYNNKSLYTIPLCIFTKSFLLWLFADTCAVKCIVRNRSWPTFLLSTRKIKKIFTHLNHTYITDCHKRPWSKQLGIISYNFSKTLSPTTRAIAENVHSIALHFICARAPNFPGMHLEVDTSSWHDDITNKRSSHVNGSESSGY